MQLSPETRSILRQYKTLINERRRESGLSPVTTAKVLDEICESATRHVRRLSLRPLHSPGR